MLLEVVDDEFVVGAAFNDEFDKSVGEGAAAFAAMDDCVLFEVLLICVDVGIGSGCGAGVGLDAGVRGVDGLLSTADALVVFAGLPDGEADTMAETVGPL